MTKTYPRTTLYKNFNNDVECLKDTVKRKVMSMDIPMPPQGDNDHRDKAKEKMVRLQRYGVTVGTIDVLREMIFSQTHIYLGISSLRCPRYPRIDPLALLEN